MLALRLVLQTSRERLSSACQALCYLKLQDGGLGIDQLVRFVVWGGICLLRLAQAAADATLDRKENPLPDAQTSILELDHALRRPGSPCRAPVGVVQL